MLAIVNLSSIDPLGTHFSEIIFQTFLLKKMPLEAFISGLNMFTKETALKDIMRDAAALLAPQVSG